jgi:MYXO-CTERM domain-containing protein
VGGADLVKDLWRYGQTHGTGYYDLFIGDAVDGEDLDFSAIYDGFIATNAVMAYEAGPFPLVEQEDSTGSLPAAGGNDGNDKPQGYGQNYIKISTSTVDESAPDLRLEFEGDSRQDWSVLLVGVIEDEVVQVQKLSLSDAVGTGVLRNYGSFDVVWLVISPLNTSTQGRSYTWDLQAIDSDTFEDTGDAVDDEKRSAAACACSQGGQGVGMLPLLLLGLAVHRRRRVC